MSTSQATPQEQVLLPFKTLGRIFKQALLLDLTLSIHVYAGILFVASLLVSGYGVYVGNHPLQIPLVQFINNPALFPNDPFAATLPYYASTLWKGVAWLTRLFPLEPLLLVLFLLERLLVIYAAAHLAKVFAPGSRLAAIGAMVLMALDLAGPTLGGNSLVVNYFEQTGVSIPFFLLTFAAFYNQRPLWGGVWYAIGFNCNSMFGVYAGTYMAAVFLLDPAYRQNWKKWLPGFGLFLLLASPAIVLTIVAFGRPAGDQELWYLISQARFPHHLFPLTWNPVEFGKYGVLLGLVLTLLYQHRARFGKLFRHGTIWAGVSVLWLIYAFVAAYVTKSPSMLVMHPGRGLTLWYGFASVALIAVCAVWLESSRGFYQRSFLVTVFSAAIVIWHPIVGPYILAVLLVAISLKPIWHYVLCRGSTNRLALLLTIWVILMGLVNTHERLGQDGNLRAALINEPSAPLLEVSQWANQNTPQDAVFLVDPKMHSFRPLAQRPVFLTWKDGSAILWDRSFVGPWTERLRALGLEISQKGLAEGRADRQLGKLYKQLRDADVKQLQSRFSLRYWVVEPEHPSNLPIVFQNQHYKVLDLGNP